MKVVRLGPPYSTDYVPDELVEGYSSMIWTERFSEDGEFELKTTKVAETMSLLPEDTLISHLGTSEVMLVETHKIGVSPEGDYELTVSGRDLGAFIKENRFVEAPYQKKRQMARQYAPWGAVAVLLYNALDNNSGIDVTQQMQLMYGEVGDNPPAPDISWTTLDRWLNVAITNSVNSSTSPSRWWLREGNLGTQLLNILLENDLGIRTIRPSGSSGKIVTVASSPPADRGIITQTFTSNITKLRFDVYDGLNRSANQSTNDVVGFNYIQGDFDGGEYLFSVKDLKTAVEIMASKQQNDVYRSGTSGYSGIRRRVTSIDAGEPDLPEPPEKPEEPRKNATTAQKNAYADALDKYWDRHAAWKIKRDEVLDDFKADNIKEANRLLKQTRRLSMFNGDISPIAPYKYKTHYNLGDTVSLYGDYDQVEQMIVSEHTLTEDAEGELSLPGLTAI